MPNRRYEQGRDDRSWASQAQRGLSRRSRQSRRNEERFEDYRGQSPYNENYQFDRDPTSFDPRMTGSSEYRHGRGSAGPQSYRSEYDYNNYQDSNRDDRSYWSPVQQDVSWGAQGEGINSHLNRDYGRRDYGSANAPGSYQGHGIDIGPNYGPTEGSNWGTHLGTSSGTTYESDLPYHQGQRSNQEHRPSANYGSFQGSGTGYGAYQGSPGSGYGSYSGTAGSNYGSYEASPTRRQNISRYGGVSATDQYEGLATGFSGPFRNENKYQPQQQQGQFVGRGPKGYRRPDERIKDDVCYSLMQAPHVDASQIEVHVDRGAVTLTGSVTDRNMKRMAEDCLENVQGVTDVHNQLKVQSFSSSSSSSTGSESLSKSGASSGSSDADFTQDSKSRLSNKKS